MVTVTYRQKTSTLYMNDKPEVAKMARKGVKVECGHCSFVARTAAAMEEHMKEHDTDTSAADPGDTPCGSLGMVCGSQQEFVAAVYQDLDRVDTSSDRHCGRRGECSPVQDVAYERLEGNRLREPCETKRDSVQDRVEDSEEGCVTLERMSDDEHNNELSRSDTNQGCQLKITQVRTITEDTDSYSADDYHRDCFTDGHLSIMSVRSIKQEPEFNCKEEPNGDESANYRGFNEYSTTRDRPIPDNVDGSTGNVCETVKPDAIKPEPGEDSTQLWEAYQPMSGNHVNASRDRSRDAAPSPGRAYVVGDGGENYKSYPETQRQWKTYFDITRSVKKKGSIDVVGFGDGAHISDTDSATDSERSLKEAVQLSLWRIKRRRRSEKKPTSSVGEGKTTCGSNDTDRVSSLSADAPNLFAALTEPGAEAHANTTASDDEHERKKRFDHQDHTYADTGKPGSLTCARERPYDEVMLTTRRTRKLRPRRAPTMTASPQEISAGERPKTVHKRKSPNKISAILEALSPTKNSEIGPELPCRVGTPRKKSPAKSSGNARSSPGETTMYVCTICENSFVTRTIFCSHVINCHREVGGRLYYCAYCQYLAMDIALVKSHMDIVHGDHATRVIAAGLDSDAKCEGERYEGPTKLVQIRVSDRVIRRNQIALSKVHVKASAFVEAVVTRKGNKCRKNTRRGGRNPRSVVGEDELKNTRDLASRSETAVTSMVVASPPHRSNRKARKSQSTGRLRERDASLQKLPKSPSTTHTSCVQSSDCWLECPDDDELNDCVPELVDDTCCEMFENSFLSLEWDYRETLGQTVYGVSDPFETFHQADAPAAVKQEPLTDTIGVSSNRGQGSGRYSRRTRKPKRPHCMCGSCDEEYAIAPRRKPQKASSGAGRTKVSAAVAGDMSCDRLLMSEVGDKVVVFPWDEEDPKLKMTPIVRLCDIVVAILAGGGGYTLCS